ncbi:MAG TPA: PHB depolymerase family esterase [Ideonella sp.]|nr:PHB depolymerase family esterase [Ideonella sp.]
MARRRSASSIWTRSLQRSVRKLTQATLKAGNQALKKALVSGAKTAKPAKTPRPARALKPGKPGKVAPAAKTARRPARPAKPAADPLGLSLGPAGARRYRLYTPPGLRRGEKLPLLVMLHGCSQSAESFALSTRMNRLAARERCFVLYPEQDRLANPQACWNWYETRSGRAQGEAALIVAAIDQVCRLQPVDAARIAVAGLSAGASMAALLAVRYPARFCAVAMHSGIAPGAASSTATALRAMSGLGRAPKALAATNPSTPRHTIALPPLLVIHGSEDHVVASSNGRAAAQLWADAAGALPRPSRVVQRGARYPVTVTDFRRRGTLAASLCVVQGLGHAWSGGTAGKPFSDPQGPDASRMIWAFVARQFALAPAAAPAPALKR